MTEERSAQDDNSTIEAVASQNQEKLSPAAPRSSNFYPPYLYQPPFYPYFVTGHNPYSMPISVPYTRNGTNLPLGLQKTFPMSTLPPPPPQRFFHSPPPQPTSSTVTPPSMPPMSRQTVISYYRSLAEKRGRDDIYSLPIIEQQFQVAKNTKDSETFDKLRKEYPEIVDYRDADGYTLLHHLVTKIDLVSDAEAKVRRLKINILIKIDQARGRYKGLLFVPDNSGYSPIDIVIKGPGKEYLSILKDFMTKGKIDRDHADKNKMTLFHKAIAFQNKEVAKFLIKNGANPNIITDTGWTPLHTAVCTREIEFLKYLWQLKLFTFKCFLTQQANFPGSNEEHTLKLDYGLTPNLEIEDCTPIRLARGHIEIERYLAPKKQSANIDFFNSRKTNLEKRKREAGVIPPPTKKCRR